MFYLPSCFYFIFLAPTEASAHLGIKGVKFVFVNNIFVMITFEFFEFTLPLLL